jgi:DNA replication protein DnaC
LIALFKDVQQLNRILKDAGCSNAGVDHVRYLLRLAELELIERERRMVERRIRAARFPAVKGIDSFDFTAIPSLNKMLVTELARGEYILRRDNIIALGPSGAGKTHIALALGLAACQRGFFVGFVTAAGLVHQLMEACDEKRLLRLQAQLAAHKLLIVDELGYVPLSPTGAELLFEVFSQRYERGLSERLPLTINVREPRSPPTCRSRNGPPSSAPNGSPARCSIASPTMSISWN